MASMCGRYNLRSKMTVLAKQFQLELGPAFADVRPRYNIAPSQDLLAVRQANGKRELVALRWGLIPSWAKDGKLAQFNGRADTVAVKPMFRSAFKKRRCLVLADGYYEWLRDGRAKLPHLYEVDGGKAFAFAGLWEWWSGPEGENAPVESCAILTTEANDLAAQVHDRMPVILDADDYNAWLRGEQIPLVPFPADRMTVRPVNSIVNNARNECPECIDPPC
jgi:putative SOS response-associated peptidase YedK